MRVYEIRLKLFLLKDIPMEKAQSKIASFIDHGLAKNEALLQFHIENKFKNYCFNSLYPIENDKIYKSGYIYTLIIRTLNTFFVKFITNSLINEHDENFKALVSQVRIIPKRYIKEIYTVTPAIIKTQGGYWRKVMTLDNYEQAIKINLIKKYRCFTGKAVDEDFQLFDYIKFTNRSPIAVFYKNITLLGDKLSLNISESKVAQELAYMSIGTGLLENNARGCGFINYRWL